MVTSGMDDTSLPLIRRIRAGDPQAAETLLRMHASGLRGFLEKRAGDLVQAKEGVSDLVQSTFREVLQDLDDVEYEDEVHFKHWLYQQALRKVVDKARYWRAQRRDAGREAGKDVGPDDSMESRVLGVFEAELGTPSSAAIQKEDLKRVEAALARLSKEHRHVILMSRFMGLPHAEIAKQTNRSEGAVRVLLHRAVAALRKELGDS